ncbi:MAG: hypothetical protein V2A67_04010 [Bacteroidota bacterium]
MDIESILSDSSRSLADYVTATVGNDPQLFNQLYDLSMQQKRQVSMRAARVMDFACERHPELIRPYLKKIIRDLPGLKDDAVKRIFMHILIRHPWVEDERLMGRLVNTLFKWLQDEAQPIAIKAYSMVILENISVLHTDLKNELALVIEEALPYWESAGLQVQGNRVIRKIRKSRAVGFSD